VQKMVEVSGGFGTVVGFVHDWATPRDNANSWDLVARYVVPAVNGYLNQYRESQQHVIDNREIFERAGQAVVAKIMENERAVAAMQEQTTGKSAIQSHNAPDLSKVNQ